jgi:hypothetical protein
MILSRACRPADCCATGPMRYFGLLALALSLAASPALAKKKPARAAKAHPIKTPRRAQVPRDDLASAVAEKHRAPEPAMTAAAPPPQRAPVAQELDDEVPGQKRRK